MFIKLDKARKVLLDREKRAKYDVWRSGGFKSVISFEKWFEMQGRAHSVSSRCSYMGKGCLLNFD